MTNISKPIAKIRRKKPKKWEIENKELENLKQKLENDEYILDEFKTFPISKKTINGLVEANYIQPTEIQKESIILALKGHDILGAAKTGSGKTLAFLIPVLEKLHHSNWTQYDGLGALIISPTRELAYQTFEVLKRVGKYHDFSAGIVIGGKDVNFEKHKISQTNIIVCTPGRLLQHLEQTTLFVCDNLQILVLDEADRILDMGFQSTLNAIIESLAIQRQTLLFSATQTKSVKDLARLSLENPIYVSANLKNQETTPQQLVQSYIVSELKEKFSLLYSFIKNHMNQKIIVFMTSCKQVKFIYSALCRMKPGMSVLALYGTMNQLKRVAAYDEFSRKQSAVLIATDIAARGLDFPEVHWVVQMDCPEDVNTYIHRVGRTARYHKDGKALLFLMPNEEKIFLKYLNDKQISTRKIDVNPEKVYPVTNKLESACAKDQTLKMQAQKCFISYLRAIYLMKDKQLFDVHKLDTDSYAYSLGLAIPPRIRFLKRAEKPKPATSANGLASSLKRGQKYGEKNNSEIGNSKTLIVETSSNSFPILPQQKSRPEEDNELFVIKKHKLVDTNVSEQQQLKLKEEQERLDLLEGSGVCKRKGAATKYGQAKKMVKLAQHKNIKLNQRIVFDENDEVLNVEGVVNKTVLPSGEDNMQEKDGERGGLDIEKAKEWLREQDVIDKQMFRAKIKAKHKEKRLKEREAKKIKDRRAKQTANDDDDGLGDVDYEEILQEDPKLANIVDSLPDPDKIYNEGEEDNITMLTTPSHGKKKNKRRKSGQDSENLFDADLKDKENIAMSLLANV